MSTNRSGRSFWRVAGLSGFAIALCLPTVAQQTRPRYTNPQPGATWTVPDGTVISARIDSNLNSRTSRPGDKFTATVTVPVYVRGKQVIMAGSTIEGHVTMATPARRGSKSGTIAVAFDDLVYPNGSRVRLDGSLTSADPGERQRIDDESRVSGDTGDRSAIFVGGGGALGAIIGGAAGGGKGAVLGGIAGAGVGIAGVLLSKGVEAEVRNGTPFGVRLNQPISIRDTYFDEGAATRQPPPSVARPEPTRPAPRLEPRSQPRRSEPPESEPDAADATLPLSSPEMIRRAQSALRDQGYYEGQIDGIMGPRTANAIRSYQREHNLASTGQLDPDTAKSLGILGRPRAAESANTTPVPTTADAPSVDLNALADQIKRQADTLFEEFQRTLGIAGTSSGAGSGRYDDSEIAVLFSLGNFAHATHLYGDLANSLGDQQNLRAATLAMAREARRADIAITGSKAQSAQNILPRWDRIRQDVLRLMQVYNITAVELEN